MTHYKNPCWLALWLWVSTAAAYAESLDRAFAVQNQNPFVNIYGLARLADGQLLDAGEWQLEFGHSIASHFEIGEAGAEQIRIDGESQRVDLTLRRGIGGRWEVGANLPFIRHSSGFLDSLIIDWHDWFNLPQNGRDLTRNDQLAFGYSGPGGALGVFDDVSGLGDVQVYLGRSLGQGTALRAQLKLPTGEERDLAGSGGVDLAVSVSHEHQATERFLWGVTGAVTYLSEGDVLPDNVRPLVAQVGARVAYQLNPWLNLKMQWDAHSQLYEDTRLRQLNEIAYILSFGGSVKVSRHGVLDIVVTENYPHPEITPDVAFILNYRHRIGAEP